MRKTIALIIGTLMLAGCQAQADGQNADDEAIYAAVKDIMCAKDNVDRSVSLSMLARRLEQYRPDSEDDSASGAVEVGLQGYEDEGCPDEAATKS